MIDNPQFPNPGREFPCAFHIWNCLLSCCCLGAKSQFINTAKSVTQRISLPLEGVLTRGSRARHADCRVCWTVVDSGSRFGCTASCSKWLRVRCSPCSARCSSAPCGYGHIGDVPVSVLTLVDDRQQCRPTSRPPRMTEQQRCSYSLCCCLLALNFRRESWRCSAE